MHLLNQLERLTYIDWLIKRKATGTPKQLAAKLEVSVVTIYRTIAMLKNEMGAPIVYCKHYRGYKYTDEDYELKLK